MHRMVGGRPNIHFRTNYAYAIQNVENKIINKSLYIFQSSDYGTKIESLM